MIKPIFDLTDEVCVQTDAPTGLGFTYLGEPAFVVTRETTASEVRHAMERMFVLYRVVSCVGIGGGIFRNTYIGSDGSRVVMHFDGDVLLDGRALIYREMGMDVQKPSRPDEQLPVF